MGQEPAQRVGQNAQRAAKEDSRWQRYSAFGHTPSSSPVYQAGTQGATEHLVGGDRRPVVGYRLMVDGRKLMAPGAAAVWTGAVIASSACSPSQPETRPQEAETSHGMATTTNNTLGVGKTSPDEHRGNSAADQGPRRTTEAR